MKVNPIEPHGSFQSIPQPMACTGLQAHAVGRVTDVTVIDRNTGATLPFFFSRGEYWVAGAPGARYAIAIRNKLGERVMAVTSVDGVNVVSGATAAFEFSAASDSYAERTGRTGQVGVIGVAVFKERLSVTSGAACTAKPR